jgi:hypothetical protein
MTIRRVHESHRPAPPSYDFRITSIVSRTGAYKVLRTASKTGRCCWVIGGIVEGRTHLVAAYPDFDFFLYHVTLIRGVIYPLFIYLDRFWKISDKLPLSLGTPHLNENYESRKGRKKGQLLDSDKYVTSFTTLKDFATLDFIWTTLPQLTCDALIDQLCTS